ncbi:MAG TPA: MBL fold metallo-hydrolase [Gemmatimonadaceae bacterium]|jgi:glyoxylase-like metal-dependent hydrolase (beta-lactamase superfamily II)|nr:MBL fold metallo-hydrolase [Gemmatimonadaceae bacterium]
MIVRQYLHTDPVVAASYVVGCGGKSACIVVDPVDLPDTYLRRAADLGMQIRFVVDTHVHADHVSMGRDLATAAGVSYLLHESVRAHYDFEPVADGARVDIGNVSVEVLHLPGHTPEHVGLLVTDRTRAPEPWLVLTGHTLMVGDMGRTELATAAEEGARALFASARRLKTLADHVTVLPGAFSGSVCGRALSGTPTSTIGFERRFNKTFTIDDESSFVAAMLRDIPPAPPRAAETRSINLGAPPVRA